MKHAFPSLKWALGALMFFVAAGSVLLQPACAPSNSAKPERICTPDNYVFCRCQDREQGSKLCNAEGTGFGRCEPCETFDNPEVPDPNPRPVPPRDASADAAKPRCGDGIPQLGEDCDDGNKVNGDGCSDRCKLDGADPLTSRSCPGLDTHVWSVPVYYVGTTRGSPNSSSATPACPSDQGNIPTTGAAASDRIFQVTAHKTGTMTVTTNDTDFDNWVYVSTACKAKNDYLTCSNKVSGTGGETMSFPVEDGKTYHVIVDGVFTDQGNFRVAFSIQ